MWFVGDGGDEGRGEILECWVFVEDDGEECVGGFVDEIEDGFFVDETVE